MLRLLPSIGVKGLEPQQFLSDQAISKHVLSYIGRRYSLELEIVHWQPNEFPSDDQWHKFEELVGARPTSWMLWEDDPAQETVDRLRDLDISIVVFRPGGNRPTKGDYLTIMRRNLERLQAAISTPPRLK